MLEIVHDLAPGAQLYFATAFGGTANMAQNIRNLRAAGCDIIVDDVFYFAETPFQDGQAPGVLSPNNEGIVAQAVADVTAGGALYFSSAGNSGNKNDGTSGVWEGDFVDGGAATGVLAGAGRVHQFPGGSTFDTVTAAGTGAYVLNWGEPIGGATSDYDLYALNAAGTSVVSAGTSDQTIPGRDPIELMNVSAVNTRIVIVKFAGVGRFLHLTTNRGRLATSTSGQTSGHCTVAAAFGVAATPAVGPFPNAFSAANQVETFSSDGPRRILFNADGTAKTPGNLTATGGELRQKPDITAADGISVTGAGGFGISFFGTSAAAPHAGAIAALLKSANPSLTQTQVRDALQNTAIDNEAPGVDRDSGYGIIMPEAALQFIGATPAAGNVSLGTATVSEVGGNANGFIEPGERGTVSMPLLNTGVAPASNVTATISSATPGVSITPSATRSYPDIAATNGTSSSATPFEFVYQPSAVYAANINFVLTVNYNGVTRSIPITVPTGQLSSISTVLDTTAPVVPAGSNFTATTGLQTSRMNFTFPISACGTTKASPGAAVSALTRRYDAYSYTNNTASPICVTVNLTHSASALLYVDAYIPTFVPATVATNFAGDNGGSATSGAGTTQLFSFTVPANQTFTVVVSESNQNGGLNVPYNLKVTGLPAAAVPANVAPVNAVPGAQNVLEDGTLSFSAAGSNPVSVSDADAGNNPVEVTLAATGGVLSLGNGTGLTFTNGSGTGDATMTFAGSTADINNALNSLSYSPAANFNGPALLTVTTNDKGNTGTGGAKSDTDTVAINVTPVNDVPAFTAGAGQTVLEDAGAQTIPNWATNLSAGPADEAGQALSFVVANDNNALFSVQPAVAPDGTLSYTSAPNANGSANITVAIKDDGGTANGGVDTSAPQTFAVNVAPVNDAPTADAQSTTTDEDNARSIILTGSDVETPGSGLTFTVTANPAHGTLSGSAPNLTYTPAANFNGSDSFTFKVTDTGEGASAALTSTEATVSLTVNAVNDAPTADAKSATTDEDTSNAITLSGSDVETNAANLQYAITSAPSHGTLTGTAPNLTYVPALNYNGPDSFQYTVTDTGDGASPALTSAPALVSIVVNAVNDAPVLSNVPASATIDELVAYAFAAHATDVDGPSLTFSLVGAPAGASIDPVTGQFTWTPTEAQGGSGVPFHFKVRVSDGLIPVDADVTLSVSEVNQSPVLAPIGSKAVSLGGTLTFTAIGSDVDIPVQTLSYSLSGAVPAGATINPATGVFTWTPTALQSGLNYAFNVVVSDGVSSTPSAVTVSVIGPLNMEQNVLAQLVALRQTTTNSEDRKELDKAIESLTDAVNLSFWLNASHLDAKRGKKSLDDTAEVVRELSELQKNKKSTIPAAVLQGFINQLLTATRLVTLTAIGDATAAGGDPKDIAKANGDLAEGDSDAAGGKPDGAVGDYRSAWQRVSKAN
jgi:hypothetical protein